MRTLSTRFVVLDDDLNVVDGGDVERAAPVKQLPVYLGCG